MHVVRISDGLGNQMFQYAFARKLQILSKKKVYLDTRFINHEDTFNQNNNFYKKCSYRKYGLNNFKIILPEADEKILLNWRFISKKNNVEKLICSLAQHYLWPWQYKNEVEKGEKIFYNLKNCIYPTYFQGYFFDLHYFDDIKNILQKEFSIKNQICLIPELQKILKEKNTVGIHVRKGDFIKLCRDISKTSYYQNAIKKINGYIDKAIYLIFSDDIEWVKENLKIDGEKFYISELGLLDYEEFIIMKHCQHNIIANSTFSYWAAYLNNNSNKVIICPKRWKSDIIPKEWIRI